MNMDLYYQGAGAIFLLTSVIAMHGGAMTMEKIIGITLFALIWPLVAIAWLALIAIFIFLAFAAVILEVITAFEKK